MAPVPLPPERHHRRSLPKGPSLVVDPPSGRVPIMPWAEERRNYKLAHIQDHWENQTTWERCITRGVPGGIFPTGYGSGYQIRRVPGTSRFLYEMIHEARIIPIDGRPHVGPRHPGTWNGDSRGRWEGNTLVVDIANYNDKGSVATNVATQRVRARSRKARHCTSSSASRASMRTRSPTRQSSRISKVFTAPWKVTFPAQREPTYQIFEYACHEGNLGLLNTLSAGARATRLLPAAAPR